MQNRIKQLIEEKGMNASRFADIIGVPRSTISHILSGRNNPSLELVQKILDAFPDVRTDWLVRGSGNVGASLPSLFSDEEESIDSTVPSVDDEFVSPPVESSGISTAGEYLKRPNNSVDGKMKVKQVILIYEDGSFSHHFPQ